MRLALFLLGLWLAPAHAFPTKPVRVIVAFTPGGVTDIIARTLMPKLAELWGQPVVVENRPGAGGSLAAQVVSRSPADGYTLLVHSSGYAINAALQPTLPYDRRDLVDHLQIDPGRVRVESAVRFGGAGWLAVGDAALGFRV